MGQLTKQIFFKAPLEVVWKIWTDVEKTPEWVEGVKQSAIVSATKYGPGLSWEEKCYFGSTMVDMEHKMVVWDEKKKTVTRTGLPMGASLEKIAEFRQAGETTEVNIVMEWSLGFAGVLITEEKFGFMLESSFESTMQNWKEKAESF
jgi:uncharacterized membrane protein